MKKKIFSIFVIILLLGNQLTAQEKINHIFKLSYWTGIGDGGALSYAFPLKNKKMTIGIWGGMASGRFSEDIGNESAQFQHWRVSPEIRYHIQEILNGWYVYGSLNYGQVRPDGYDMIYLGNTIPRQTWQSYSATTLGVGYDYKMGVSFVGAVVGGEYFFTRYKRFIGFGNIYIGFYF